jgi:hypothetical protein
MKIWISKYALSGGITEHECEPPEDGWVTPGASFMSFASFKMGRHAHDSREAAVIAANAARKKKIASIEKQIAKLRTMEF